MSRKPPEPVGPCAFRGPHRRRYTPQQLGAAYNVEPALVIRWIQGGFLDCRRRGRKEEQTGNYQISERDRMNMIRFSGSPEHPKTRLPL